MPYLLDPNITKFLTNPMKFAFFSQNIITNIKGSWLVLSVWRILGRQLLLPRVAYSRTFAKDTCYEWFLFPWRCENLSGVSCNIPVNFTASLIGLHNLRPVWDLQRHSGCVTPWRLAHQQLCLDSDISRRSGIQAIASRDTRWIICKATEQSSLCGNSVHLYSESGLFESRSDTN
jgi:hypothetical protein